MSPPTVRSYKEFKYRCFQFHEHSQGLLTPWKLISLFLIVCKRMCCNSIKNSKYCHSVLHQVISIATFHVAVLIPCYWICKHGIVLQTSNRIYSSDSIGVCISEVPLHILAGKSHSSCIQPCRNVIVGKTRAYLAGSEASKVMTYWEL